MMDWLGVQREGYQRLSGNATVEVPLNTTGNATVGGAAEAGAGAGEAAAAAEAAGAADAEAAVEPEAAAEQASTEAAGEL